MARRLEIHLLPQLATPDAFRGGAVAVFDVLRATTTICHALAAGVREVLPCLEVEHARALAQIFPVGEFLLGGERGGVQIAGFDCGNSPEEYTRAKCQSKRLIFTTTNGTRALATARQADRVYLGALCNAEALVAVLAEHQPVHLLCAGTEGHITAEDAYAAGYVAAHLRQRHADWQLNDEAALAIALAEQAAPIEVFPDSRGGRNLLELGLARDVAVAAQPNVFDFVPQATWDAAGQAHVTIQPRPDFMPTGQ